MSDTSRGGAGCCLSWQSWQQQLSSQRICLKDSGCVCLRRGALATGRAPLSSSLPPPAAFLAFPTLLPPRTGDGRRVWENTEPSWSEDSCSPPSCTLCVCVCSARERGMTGRDGVSSSKHEALSLCFSFCDSCCCSRKRPLVLCLHFAIRRHRAQLLSKPSCACAAKAIYNPRVAGTYGRLGSPKSFALGRAQCGHFSPRASASAWAGVAGWFQKQRTGRVPCYQLAQSGGSG